MIKSPLRYPGGKSRAVKIISKLIPTYDEFREPFLGGGSIYLFAKQTFPKKIYWINDIYKELYIFWKISQNNKNDLINSICEFKNKFQSGKELYTYLSTNISNFNEVQIAAAFFIFNRITFSGTTESGGYSEQAYLGRFTESSIERLKSFSDVIQSTSISNFDFEKVISKKGNNVFIFLDPPYYSATKSALYGKNGNLHKSFEHTRLAEVLKVTHHKWLMTYDDCEYIRNLYSFANISSWDLMYGMRNVNKNSDQLGKEIFISNYLEIMPDSEPQLW